MATFADAPYPKERVTYLTERFRPANLVSILFKQTSVVELKTAACSFVSVRAVVLCFSNGPDLRQI